MRLMILVACIAERNAQNGVNERAGGVSLEDVFGTVMYRGLAGLFNGADGDVFKHGTKIALGL